MNLLVIAGLFIRASRKAHLVFTFLLIIVLPVFAQQSTPEPDASCPQNFRYTFSWSQSQGCDFLARGGTTKGAELTLDPEPHPAWLALQEPGLSGKEKDRMAILAMAGPYRTSFEFLETVAYTPDFERGRPYQSWGTEYIYVVEDSENLISLQHIIVMFIEAEDGAIMGPFVQKHWRQDWQYEKPEIMVYAGNDTWAHQTVPTEQLSGSWAQSVYQVDDSPRYEAVGTWEHRGNISTWLSSETWRPVPRRESTVRDDYDVLIGTNRHTIVPTGWVQEEENYKVKLNPDGQEESALPYLSKELGVNRYERIIDFDFSAGDEYWQATSAFWADTRAVWNEVFAASEQFGIRSSVEGTPLFAVLFGLADEAANLERYDSENSREQIRNALQDFIIP